MPSNGELYYQRGAVSEWTIGFECPGHGQFQIWIPKLAPLVNQIIKDVDPDSLPVWTTIAP